MNGNVILDTNIIIYLSKKILAPEKIFSDDVICSVSIISKIELLGYPFKSSLEEKYVKEIISALYVIPINNEIVEATIQLRRYNKIKTPDAIVYATAQVMQGKLLTNNISDFIKIKGEVIISNPLL